MEPGHDLAAVAFTVAVIGRRSAGNTPALQQLILASLLSGLVLAFIAQDWLWRWDLVFYDAAASIASSTVPEDLIIVAIDDESLNQIGRWPWPRRVHAQLVRRLHEEGALAIGLDILFPEADPLDPGGDEAFVEAIRGSGRVVLPVAMEASSLGGQPLELLPAPAFAQVARTLAHVHVELDRDGLARSVFLREGLGDPHWLEFGEAMLRIANPTRDGELPGERAPVGSESSTFVWARDHHVLVPFLGPPGSIKRLSYARMLAGEYPSGTFKNALVMVGATATGMSDSLATPVSGHGAHMPGVEFHANVLAALRDNTTISVLPTSLRAPVSVLIVLLLLVMYPRLSPRRGLLAAVTFIVMLLVICLAMLLFARLWFAPAAVLVALVLSYPLWSWLRLEFAMRFLAQELQRLQREQVNFSTDDRPSLGARLAFLSAVLPIDGYLVIDPQGSMNESVGNSPSKRQGEPSDRLLPDRWQIEGDVLWTAVEQHDALWSVGLKWQHASGPTSAERRMLDVAIRVERRKHRRKQNSRIEVVQERVTEIQHASARLRSLRDVIDGTLEQMQHGMLLIDMLGRVQLFNRKAAEFLLGDADGELHNSNILDVLQGLQLESGADWPAMLKQLLVEREPVRLACGTDSGRDLLGHAAPMVDDSDRVVGAIFNLADISPLRQSERRRTEMLNIVSHDLRLPLVSIIALSELASGQDESDDVDRVDVLRRVGEHATRTLNLAEQFLELARAQGDEELASNDVDLMMVSMDALDGVWPQAEAKSIDLDPRIDVDEAYVVGDARLLERVFVNLLTNAVKYSPEGATVGIELRTPVEIKLPR